VNAIADAPAFPVRPGVWFPDWSAVTSPTARDALRAILNTRNMENTWQGYAPMEDRVRVAVLRHYGTAGRAPEVAALAARLGMTAASVKRLLGRLAARDLVVLEGAADRVVGAYPFTDRDTEHRVRLGRSEARAMCAIDALGAGAMLGQDVEVRSRCRACGRPIRVATRDRGAALVDVDPASALVWSGIRYENGCAATSLCTVIAFFCSDGHLESWRANERPDVRGYRLDMDEALQLGRAIFAPALAGTAEPHGR
jgi:hypothetical protein